MHAMTDEITRDDLISNLELIEMLTATGSGLDPETTMRVHLLAGLGRASHDKLAWFTRAEADEAQKQRPNSDGSDARTLCVAASQLQHDGCEKK